MLELIGIVRPGRSRREPIALPAWSRWVLVLLVPTMAVASTLVYVLARGLLS